jgi:predicted phage terminase large subunit-like protein
MCAHVQALLEGKLALQNLMELVPPGFGKSTVVSVMAPAWRWIRQPSWRAIFASGNATVSLRDSMKCRDIVESQWYRRTFGIAWSLADDQNAKGFYRNTATGFRMAVSAGSKITGDRANAIFCDDALDASDCYSKAERDRVNFWWDAAYANRLSDMRTGTRCIIQQRLHPEDLAGHVLEVEGDQWEVLIIPQEWEESRRTVTSLGWTDPRTADGLLAFEARFSPSSIAAEKNRLGASGYVGQHQQRPAIAAGEVFKRAGLRLLTADALPKCSQVIVSVDSAFKTGEENDYSVAVVLGQFPQGIILLDIVRGRFAYPQLKQVITELGARIRPAALLIEDKASGQSLIQDLKQTTTLPVRPVSVDGDKLMRAHTIVPTWEAGRIHAVAGAPWLGEFLDELCTFPKAPHDDMVDAFVQGVRYLTQGPAYGGLVDYYKVAAQTAQASAKQESSGLSVKTSTTEAAAASPAKPAPAPIPPGIDHVSALLMRHGGRSRPL